MKKYILVLLLNISEKLRLFECFLEAKRKKNVLRTSNVSAKWMLLPVLVILFSCKKEVKRESQLIDFVPNNPTAVIVSKSIANLQHETADNEFLKTFKNTNTYEHIQKRYAVLNEISSQNEILVGYGTVGKSLECLLAIKAKNTTTTFKKDSIKREYNGVAYRKLKNHNAYSLIIDSTLVVSSSDILIENLIRNQKDNIKYSDPNLFKLFTASEAETTFFMNAEKLPKFVKSVFPTSYLSNKGWLSFETNADGGISINGVATDNKVTNDFITQLQQSDIEKSTVHEIIPENVTHYSSYNFEEIKNFKSPFDNFAELIDNTTEAVSFTVKDANLCAFKIDNTVVLDNLQEISTYRSVVIYKNTYYKIPTIINPVQPEYVCFLADFMIMANTEVALQNGIAHYQNKTTLKEQPYYQENAKALLRASHIVNGVKTNEVVNKLAKSLADATLLKVSTKKYPLLMHQITYEDGHVQFNSVLQKVTESKGKSAISQMASVTLDAEIAMQPQWIKNHKTNQKDLVVQDVNNVLYLISNTGKIVWKKQLEAKIKGNIKQIDIYKNKRLQMAFTTDTEFMVLDRNGKNVKPFYKKFADGGLLPLAVFDYDNSRNYRFVIAQNESVFMFDNKMKAVKGFKFKKAKSTILYAPKHLRVGTKDYIVIAEKNGKLHILNRQGKSRTKVKKSFKFGVKPLLFTKNNIVFIADKSQVQQVNVSTGAVKKIDILLSEESTFALKDKVKVKLEGQNLTIKNKTIELDYGTYTQPKIEYVNRKYYVSVTDLDTQKVFLYNSKGQLLPNFPVYGKSDITLANADKDSYLEFAVQGENNAILIYKMK